MDARQLGVWGRVIVATICWALCVADANGFLVYHPSGRGETRLEKIAHTLLIGGGFLIGLFFYVMAVWKGSKRS